MRTFGIIGYPLSHSFSQRYFAEKFKREGIDDAVFLQFPIQHIDELPQVLQQQDHLQGIAVTIPYKKAVLRYLHKTTEAVQLMNACNCIRVTEGKLYGYNTDVTGFEQSFTPYLQPHHTRALILGTGGAAAAVEYVLKKLHISYQSVSREPKENCLVYEQLDATILEASTVIINTTPLGTFPNTEECPAIPYQLLSSRHYLFDLVYNPPETQFLRLGKAQGAIVKNGYDMLTIQAEENWQIWNGQFPI